MKILQVHQLKAADAYTIIQEPITPIDLMERAAQQCVHWILTWGIAKKPVSIFCGKGGNGGDGLAIARLLANKGINASVYILEFGKKGTPEFQANLERLHALPLPLHFIQSEAHFPQLFQNTIVIDALYGFGLDRPLDGLRAALVHYINESDAPVISIDLPSGLFADKSSVGNTVINATHTLTFECYKLGLLVAENAPFIGTVHVLPIQLHPQFLEKTQTDFEFVDDTIIRKIFKPRPAFAHKGSFGHALIAGGSFGKIGALVLATQACLRSGGGLVTTYMPRCGYEIMQTAAPEAMAMVDKQIDYLNAVPPQMERFDSLGVGPGMGTDKATGDFLLSMISNCKKPVVLDADALNLLALNQKFLSQLFLNTILTPHPKEFERLFGPTASEFDRIILAREKAIALQIIIILKGHHTLIALPNGKAFFNSTGNAGMAKGGSGDVLTGIIASLLAQGYEPPHAAILGVYVHGRAGDVAAKALSQEAMTARDIIKNLSTVFLALHKMAPEA